MVRDYGSNASGRHEVEESCCMVYPALSNMCPSICFGIGAILVGATVGCASKHLEITRLGKAAFPLYKKK